MIHSSPAPLPSGATSPSRLRVLICDDDPRYLELLGFMLESESFEVMATTDSQEVQALALHWRPDLVLTDVAMPGMDGYDLAYGLRADPRTAEIPLIFFTARTSDLDRLEAQNAGAADYLLKPMAMTELVWRIRNALVRHRREYTP